MDKKILKEKIESLETELTRLKQELDKPSVRPIEKGDFLYRVGLERNEIEHWGYADYKSDNGRWRTRYGIPLTLKTDLDTETYRAPMGVWNGPLENGAMIKFGDVPPAFRTVEDVKSYCEKVEG